MMMKQEADVVSDVSQCKQTDSRLMSEMNMEKSLQQESSALEDFSSPRHTHTPEDGVLERRVCFWSSGIGV